MNLELKIALIRRYGGQIRAAKPLKVDEARLSRLVQGHREPTAKERARFAAKLGADYFKKGKGNDPKGQTMNDHS
jgi:plasmid maintenance system antidote protein VapI